MTNAKLLAENMIPAPRILATSLEEACAIILCPYHYSSQVDATMKTDSSDSSYLSISDVTC